MQAHGQKSCCHDSATMMKNPSMQINQMMDQKYNPMSDANINHSFEDSAPVVRIYFLRSHLYLQHQAGSGNTNWDAIDEHLEKIKGKSPNYKQA
ncbi:hypothetical protein VP01_7391g1 [Puccinia sorghi]|uniref:Uncharacterized protein n=1 Tax=Puccinia sorghi TaxID=27349 RepID=A0A0L6UET0_9BASI|nr:hypothetical protein VP01_7391g1 [Puccinia sorghi]